VKIHNYIVTFGSLFSVALAALAGTANAAIIPTTEYSATTSFTSIPALSNSDLAEGIAPTLDPSEVMEAGSLANLTDGVYNSGYSACIGAKYDGSAKVKFDLGATKTIGQINTFGNEPWSERNRQKYALYGSASPSDPGWDTSSYTFIASVDMAGDGTGTMYSGVTIQDDAGGNVGSYRWLLWNEQGTGGGGACYTGFDVVEGLAATVVPEPATVAVWSLLGLCWAGVSVLRRRRKGLAQIDAAPVRRGWSEENRVAIRRMLDRQLTK